MIEVREYDPAWPRRFETDRLGLLRPGELVGLALRPSGGLGLAFRRPGDLHGVRPLGVATDHPAALVAEIEARHQPRWVLWDAATAGALVAGGVRVARAWHLAAVHRIIFGGWSADPAAIWARLHDLPVEDAPRPAPPDLFSAADTAPEDPLSADGYLKATWLEELTRAPRADPRRLATWAGLAIEAAGLQEARLRDLGEYAPATARSESAAELLCAEMSSDGLPIDRRAMEAIIAAAIGPRPHNEAEAAANRQRRDLEVLSQLPHHIPYDLRSPGQVQSLLAAVGIEVPDTRASRLRELRDRHPVVGALLTWRKAERIATTYGYQWLDHQVGADGRLRGEWAGSDGAAGRMTASAGLHNLPADMRAGVVAEPGHVFVRADLGQIEPRILAAVSSDRALARATLSDDMYAPVAEQLGVERSVAKVAVLGAMYGQTTGHGAQALRRLVSAYPVAMAYLERADQAGQASAPLRTHGGRLIPMGMDNANELTERAARARAAARGRYGRNATVQGAAAEFFKVWAVTVRARAAALEARIVLCLHDELLLHVPIEAGQDSARLLDACLQEAAARWAPSGDIRFIADIAVVRRWSDAKGTLPAA